MERDFVIRNLNEAGSVFTIAPAPSSSAKNFFPIVVQPDAAAVGTGGVIFFAVSNASLSLFVNQTVKVQFYSNHLGLYFFAVLSPCSRGFSVQIPADIYRIQRKGSHLEHELEAVISFKSKGNRAISITGVSADGYNLSAAPSWIDVEPSIQQTALQCYEHLVPPERESKSLYMIPVCRYLVQRPETEAVEGVAKPLDILYVDERRIVFGCRNQQTSPLVLDAEYALSLTFKLGDEAFCRRSVSSGIKVNASYSSHSGGVCFICSYVNLKIEDARFIFDRFSGRKSA